MDFPNRTLLIQSHSSSLVLHKEYNRLIFSGSDSCLFVQGQVPTATLGIHEVIQEMLVWN